MGTQTPWGISDQSNKIARGIMFYSTPSHGGYHLSKTMNAGMPEPLRIKNGWYEEDCAWARVALGYPQFFSLENLQHAHCTMKSWAWEAYEAFRRLSEPGYELPFEESRGKSEARWYAQHRNDYIVVSATDLNQSNGMVKVDAVRGGRDPKTGGYASNDMKSFLIPKDEYRKEQGDFGFVVRMSEGYQEIG